ncbi:MAG: TraR/DksA C4-type zinc finger protein [Thermoprotei archaeon]|nr:TraR/DksA C4-type zinc finger protein [Thermoprotei archaeon]
MSQENSASLRRDIEEMIKRGDLKGLLYKAGELHGHLCPYLAYGVMAGYIAVRELKVRNTGMEELIAIVEANNCFCDGIQVVTGCTFGNNALIFKDLGKTAVTVARRDGTAIRIVLNPDFEESRVKEYPEAYELWNKIVVRREKVTEEEQRKLMKLFAEISIKELNQPLDKVFKIEHLKIKVPEYAPIFTSVRCSICGEKIMEPKARVKDGKPVCIKCAKEAYYVLNGSGISVKASDSP